MDGIIRKAKKSEFSQIKDIYERICEGFKTSPYTSNWNYGEYPSDEMLQSAIQDGSLYVLISDECVAGAMVVKLEEDKATLNLLAVDPAYRGRRYGECLLSELEDIVRESGLDRIEFVVVAGNLPAIRIYKKAGYDFSEEQVLPVEGLGDVRYYICSKTILCG